MRVVTSSSPRGHRLAIPSVYGLLALMLAGEAALNAQTHWSETKSVTPRRRYGMAFDPNRGRIMLTGGNGSRGTAQTNTFNDSWEWDGARWSTRNSTLTPTVSDLAKMVYDTANKRLTLFLFSSSGVGETWTWAGRTWARRNPAATPTARNHYGMAYDEARARIVLFGGSNASGGQQDVWEFDGTNWIAIGASGPSLRNDPAMAWDGVRRRVILHGGRTLAVTPAPLDDTWEWDGSTWTRMTPTTVPPARNAHAMAWNPLRNRVLMHGGGTATPGTVLDDTWEWDGTNWTRVVTATTPPARSGHGMVFDSARSQMVIAAGEWSADLRADTWAFNGTNWLEVGPEPAPPSRSEHAAAFDEARGNLILFGGRNPQLQALNDTWEWSSLRWRQLTPTTAPAGRYDHAMTYDPVRQVTVLFGGLVGVTPQNDTWIWNGTNWSLVSPTNRPSARSNHAMVWDPTNSRIVLFGGITPTAQSDTWAWDGTNWSQITTATFPPARSAHAMGYDVTNQRIVLCGGRSAANIELQDTWQFDGTAWAQALTGNLPSTRANHVMALDGRRNRLMVFGGAAGTSVRGDTLEWTGTGWASLTLFPAPLGRHSQTLTYEASQRRLLMFGGENAAGRRNDTWVLSSAAAGAFTPIAATGCPGGGASSPAQMETFGTAAVGNTSFAIDLYTQTPVTSPLPVFFVLSLTQGSVSLPNCPLAIDPNTIFLTAYRLQTSEFASLQLPIPNNLALVGGAFVVQALHVQPPTALNGLAVSAGYRAVIGDL